MKANDAKRKHFDQGINPGSVISDIRRPNFSFDRLEDNETFPVSECDREFFVALLRTLRYYCEMSMGHFQMEDDTEGRHMIVWSKTSMPDGFGYSKPDDIGTDIAWQFGLRDEEGNAKRTKWRVHGYIRDETFCIVWLDSKHALQGTEEYKTSKRKERKK